MSLAANPDVPVFLAANPDVPVSKVRRGLRANRSTNVDHTQCRGCS